MQRSGWLVAVALLAAAMIAACTSGTGDPSSGAPTSSGPSATPSAASSAASPVIASPIDRGPTTAARARSCPFLATDVAADRIGQRLDKVRVLVSGGRTIGCRLYPLGHPTSECDRACLDAEHLPPPTQASVEIVSSRFRSAGDARAAVVRAATGADRQPLRVGAGTTGFCYRIEFYVKDRGNDWACAFAKGPVSVVVRTATTESFNAMEVTRSVAAKF